jgi:ABC-type multidrug transport system ATPase subunit
MTESITGRLAVAEMVDFLARFYGICPETAAEVIAELRDKTSLQSLAGFRRVARAVNPPPPKTF